MSILGDRWQRYHEDTSAAIGAMSTVPWLMVGSAALALAPILVRIEATPEVAQPVSPRTILLSALWIPVAILQIGWPGVERAVLAEAYLGRATPVGAVPRLVRKYFGRFFRLAVLVGLPFAGAHVLVSRAFDVAAFSGLPVLIVGFVGGVLMTFMPAVLAFESRSAVHGLRVGLRDAPHRVQHSSHSRAAARDAGICGGFRVVAGDGST